MKLIKNGTRDVTEVEIETGIEDETGVETEEIGAGVEEEGIEIEIEVEGIEGKGMDAERTREHLQNTMTGENTSGCLSN